MKSIEAARAGAAAPEGVMRLRSGFNEMDDWRRFALAPQRERFWEQLREVDTRVIRIAVFDRHVPDPAASWDEFASYAQAVLNAGAVPMVTFAKFEPPYDDPGAVCRFAGRCADVVARCLERWGDEAVRDWYWCVWHHPNSEWVSAGLTFEHYRAIYEEVAQAVARLTPSLGGRKPRIGGPAADGFQPFWLDWVWRLVNEIDNALIGFVSWHRYGDWREPGAWGAPSDERVFQALLMARTPDYETRARAVARVLKGRDILNVCGEWNAHSHHEARVSARFNQSAFGAAYYASALLHLFRGGADLELWRGGTGGAGPYGVMDSEARPNPVLHARKLCARHLRPSDRVSFPGDPGDLSVHVARSRGEAGRDSALLVHVKDERATYPVAKLTGGATGYRTVFKIDRGTDNRVEEAGFDGTVTFEGYGIAVATSPIATT
jgi:hypothetical protein